MNRKIIYLALMTFGFMGLVGCEEDDDNEYAVPNYVAGKWNLTQVGSLNSQSVLTYEDVVKNDECEYDSVNFGADYNFVESDYNFTTTCNVLTFDGKYQTVDGNIILNYNDTNPTDNIDPEVRTLDIVVLTNSSMELVYTDESNELAFLKFTKVN